MLMATTYRPFIRSFAQTINLIDSFEQALGLPSGSRLNCRPCAGFLVVRKWRYGENYMLNVTWTIRILSIYLSSISISATTRVYSSFSSECQWLTIKQLIDGFALTCRRSCVKMASCGHL